MKTLSQCVWSHTWGLATKYNEMVSYDKFLLKKINLYFDQWYKCNYIVFNKHTAPSHILGMKRNNWHSMCIVQPSSLCLCCQGQPHLQGGNEVVAVINLWSSSFSTSLSQYNIKMQRNSEGPFLPSSEVNKGLLSWLDSLRVLTQLHHSVCMLVRALWQLFPEDRENLV